MPFLTARQLDYTSYREAKEMGQQFAAWLNLTGGTRLVLKLIDLEWRIRKLNEEHTGRITQLSEDEVEEDEIAENMVERLEEMSDEFNRLISRCQIYPHLMDTDFYGAGWTFRWDLVRAPRKQLHDTNKRFDPSLPIDDLDALLAIVRLAQWNMLSRLRHCHCKRWYFERIPNQQFCSAKCRQLMFSKSEKFRAHRREYMRRYYRLKTSGKVK